MGLDSIPNLTLNALLEIIIIILSTRSYIHFSVKLLLITFLILISCGCRTYNSESEKAQALWSRGQFVQAAEEYSALAEKNRGSKDQVIFYLEAGTANRAANQLGESQSAFQVAAAKVDEYESKAKISVTRESGATFSNQANLPYRGRAYDKIMLHTYRALNYWQQGEFDKVRPEIFSAYQRQQDAVEENRRAIEKAQEEARKSGEKDKIDRARKDPRFQSQLRKIEAKLDNIAPYGDYVNPFTVFLDALFFHYNSELRTDLERSQKSFERMLALVPNNPYLKKDKDLVDQRMSRVNPGPMTYVIFETGRAPRREQIRIDIPIIISRVSYLGVAFPELSFNENYHRKLKVSAGSDVLDTALLASMDRIVGTAFKKELPVIVTKTLVATIVKAAAAYAINEAANESGAIIGLLSQIGTAVAQATVNIADLRTWTTLPKEFQYCHLPTPQSGSLTLRTSDGSQSRTVALAPGQSHIVYVHSVNKNAPLTVHLFNLN